ncbi:MAG: peptidylprolyl isomerase [Sulfurimonas sp.]|jgi:peptidylprolyl isomerase|uniref:peptidylprolyl isomerase n=1 Tax=Sulfurimonas sp. TaxID=2022749 RepID=UPI0039E4A7DD
MTKFKNLFLSIALLLSFSFPTNTFAATVQEKIAGLYIAFFNRAADQGGLTYWEGQATALGEENAVKTLAEGFAGHTKFTSLYAAMSEQEYVEAIYINTLGQAGDSDGINYWRGLIEDGMSRSDMVASFVSLSLDFDRTDAQYASLTEAVLDAAQQRRDLLTNKVAVSLEFVSTLGLETNLDPAVNASDPDALDADSTYQASVNIISGVTYEVATRETARNLIYAISAYPATAMQVINAIKEQYNSITDDTEIVGNIQLVLNNKVPVANAGSDQNIYETSVVTLDGSLSSDADSNTLTYSWSITSKPSESNATLSNSSVVNPTLNVDINGTYLLSVFVNDGTVNSAIDTVTITLNLSTENPHVVLETTQGNIEIALFPNEAPLAVENFITHINNGYYDGIAFHRIIKDFMIQGGDPTESGFGGESIWGEPFKDEFKDQVFDKPGLLAMANSGPGDLGPEDSYLGTNGSQFFITSIPTSWLTGNHTIFGEITTDSFETLEKLNTTSTDDNDKPIERQEIIKAYLIGTYEIPNPTPVAHAGTDQEVEIGTTVTLDGSNSSAGVSSLTYSWTLVTKPDTSNATLSSTSDIRPVFTADVIGTYTFNLIVYDSGVVSTQDSVTVNVTMAAFQSGDTWNDLVYETVISPYTGKIWLDRNLGASRVCTALDDTACYGDYYQWGRNADGHEKSTSENSVTRATGTTDLTSDFFINNSDWTTADNTGLLRIANWSATDGSSVCPVGYRVANITELVNEITSANAPVNDNIKAFENFLKLPSAGYRSYLDGSLNLQGSYGIQWSLTFFGSDSIYLMFLSDRAEAIAANNHANGFSVRCIKD